MGLETQSNGDGAQAAAAKESPFQLQLVAEQEPKKQEVKPEARPQEEAKPEMAGRPGGGGPPGGGHQGGPERPPSGPPHNGGDGGGRRPDPPHGPEGPPHNGGDGGGRRPDPTHGPDGPPHKPDGPPHKPDGPPHKPDGPPHKPDGPPHGPPDGPPHHHPDPHPPRPEPHPGDPHHGFHPGRPWEPPVGRGWGWEDGNRWGRGWDPWFFQRDPNWNTWQSNIEVEADFVAGQLDSGNAQGAAAELSADLMQMRGDIYAQDQLISRVNQLEVKGVGADLNLGNWDPFKGTWDNMTITPDPGDNVTPVQSVNAFDSFGNPIP